MKNVVQAITNGFENGYKTLIFDIKFVASYVPNHSTVSLEK
jgi:hypothetical protein